jgi:hypothetical protein
MGGQHFKRDHAARPDQIAKQALYVLSGGVCSRVVEGLARVGPRPVYSLSRRTTALEISAAMLPALARSLDVADKEGPFSPPSCGWIPRRVGRRRIWDPSARSASCVVLTSDDPEQTHVSKDPIGLTIRGYGGIL